MPSPFPGMDPYIEAAGLWRPFHSRLIARIIDVLEEILPERYQVRPDERNILELVEEEGKASASFYPDVGVVGPRTPLPGAGSPTTPAETSTEVVSMRPLIGERIREEFVEITTEDPDRRLVTCIEVLSPSNKRKGSESWKEYLRKRQALLLGQANLVEIDLLRGGTRLPMLDPWPNSPYTLLVARGGAPACRVWPAHSTRPLPALVVPLEEPDPDLTLDLQALVTSVYERGRYARDIDYGLALDPPLSEEERTCLQGYRDRQPTP